MRVLVTGGTGYLGSAIVRALARRDHEPVVFARHASAARLPGTPIDGDIRDRAAVLRAVDGADAVCHAAALVSVWRPSAADFDDVNVEGLRAILDACRAHATPRIVYTSSFLARPPQGSATPLSANDYQRTKVLALDAARRAAADGMPIVTLVPGVIYGPGTRTEGDLVGRMIDDHRAGRLPGLIGADRTWSFAYIDDVAEAHVSALTQGLPGREYALGGENVPQMRAFEIVRAKVGGRLPRRVPPAIASLAAALAEARTAIFGTPPLLTRGVVTILQQDWPLDSRPAVEALSYGQTPLESGLGRMLASSR
jgi:nucleoside-diphosphate-sugar epimerase